MAITTELQLMDAIFGSNFFLKGMYLMNYCYIVFYVTLHLYVLYLYMTNIVIVDIL